MAIMKKSKNCSRGRKTDMIHVSADGKVPKIGNLPARVAGRLHGHVRFGFANRLWCASVPSLCGERGIGENPPIGAAYYIQ